MSRKTRLDWTESKFAKGKFAGPFWGAKAGVHFLMIVPRAKTRRTPAYFELWFDGIVYDETKSPTLPLAKQFAASVLAKRIEADSASAAA